MSNIWCSILPTKEAKWKHLHPRWVVPLNWPWTITCICRFSPVTRMKSLLSAWSAQAPLSVSICSQISDIWPPNFPNKYSQMSNIWLFNLSAECLICPLRHHSVSAAWDGEGAGTPGREEQESWNTLFEGSQVAQILHASSIKFVDNSTPKRSIWTGRDSWSRSAAWCDGGQNSCCCGPEYEHE